MARAILAGTPISPGIAIGSLMLLPDGGNYEQRVISEAETEREIGELKAASAKVCADLEASSRTVPEKYREYREIIASQMELARDQRLLDGAIGRIRAKKICAAWAVAQTVAEIAAMFHDLPDPYLSDRALDIEAIGKRLVNALAGDVSSVKGGEPFIAAAWDISPADFMDYSVNGILGIATVQGGATSHTAILARSLKAPAIGGVNDLFRDAKDGETVIVDGFSGKILFQPTEEEIARYESIAAKNAAFEQEAMSAALLPAMTRDNKVISVQANLDNVQELAWLEGSGAEGIGLYRTEYAYMGARLPDEDSLYHEYRSILAGVYGEPVVFRTLDAGADKILPAQEALKEPNPALGLRGIRFSLARKDIFRCQLRALLKAGVGGKISLMLPMVSAIAELRQTKTLIGEVEKELADAGIGHCQAPPIGVMVETPAAVLICSELARECDFISLGTNDLLHYMLAIDRNNRHVFYLHEPLHPAFLRAVEHAVKSAHAYGKKVSVCGELASDPLGAALLLGLGVDVLSATPRFVPTIKHLVRKLDAIECEAIARDALAGADIGISRERLRSMLTKNMDSDILFSNSLFTGGDGQ